MEVESKKTLEKLKTYYRETTFYGKRIIIEQEKKQKKINENKTIYKENIKQYEKFIETVAKIVNELALPNNQISYTIIIARLIHEGWISRDLSFKVGKDKKVLDILGYLGIDVVNGYGCCRHISNICALLLKNLNVDSDYFYCYSDEKNISLKEGIQKDANHVINLFTYENLYYGYDALNKVFYIPIDGFQMESYVREQETKPRYLFMKADYDMVHSGKGLIEIENKKKTVPNLI